MEKKLLPLLLSAFLWLLAGEGANAQSALSRLTIQDGVCQIGTAEDLANLVEAIEDGNTNLDVLLTADIDLTESETPSLMIGNSGARYAGTFDGGFHTVTYSYEVGEDYCGLFRYIDGATIRNLFVKGDAVVTSIHFGALAGYVSGEVLVENVVTDVDIIGVRSGVTGDGGMVGRLEGPITFNNCATLGEMGNEGSSMYCGFVAYAGNGTSVLNNCFTTCILSEGTGTDYCYTFCRGTCQLNNCYYLNPVGVLQGSPVTEEQIASGSLCYKLNGDQSEIFWTQTIGQDLTPVPGTGSLRVYATGTLRCDGKELEDNPLDYSNAESYPIIPDHQFGIDGTCIVCGTPDPNAVQKDEDGFYLIGTPEQLAWLALRIEHGETDLKVLLTDDINLSASNHPELMIATEDYPFIGIFDGGGHTITYSYDEVPDKWRGLFRSVKNATIRNLRVEGEAFPTNIHYGALIGVANGTVLVENVVTNVLITGIHSGVTGDAGMVGANYANMTFNNCATLGEMGYEGSSMYSSFSGWSDGNSFTTLNNCYTTCRLTEGTGLSSCFTMTHSGGKVTLNNCYYLYEVGRVQGTAIEEDQLASGELCHKLNGDQSEIGWYQTLGEDEIPVPDASHQRVYAAGTVFMNVTDDASFSYFVSTLIEEEKELYGETIAQMSLISAYLEDLEALSSSPDIDTFIADYNALADQRQSIQSCAEAYAAYIAKVEETEEFLNDNPKIDNAKARLLRSYLTEYNEPTDDFPHGSAKYILDKLELSEEEIKAETALIDTKLTEAIAATTVAGTEITMLFTNADLRDEFNGWEGKPGTGTGTSATSPIVGAECFNDTMDMYQTLTGLQNGIYELQVNGAYRPYPYNDFYNVNYAATLYTNNIHNFFQTNIEGMIDVEDAIDGVNCNITGSIADFPIEEDDEVIGYTMQGVVSCANAFQAGRYPNSVLCYVTDGTLTIGIRQPGSGQQPDWLGFGNIKVFYYGELDEAGESLDRVLASQADRASTILYTYEPNYETEYALYPNFSEALKGELEDALKAVASADTPEAKYQLIEKFSELFLQIYESKQAYITVMDMAEEVNSILDTFSEFLSEDEFLGLEALYTQLIDGYMDGGLSTEEIRAIDLKQFISFYPEEEDGYYLIRSMKDFSVFASLVNGGKTEANAKLFVDIDMRDSEDYPNFMIGNENAQFAGTFDGQGHTISYSYTGVDTYGGLFRYIDGATIRNLRVEGSAVVEGIHFGALAGYANNTVLIENVITDVDIIGDRSGVTGDGGMFGRLEGNVTFNNCATLGDMGNPGSSMYCGFVAYSGSGSSTLNNCYTACTLTEGTGVDYCYTFCRGTATFNNCYYLNQIGEKQGRKMSLEQFQSGEVCYRLNGDQSDIHWYQSITADDYPVLDPSHPQVWYYDNIYTNVDPDAITDVLATEPVPGGIYDITGRRVQKMQKGLYIVNGKKVFVK